MKNQDASGVQSQYRSLVHIIFPHILILIRSLKISLASNHRSINLHKNPEYLIEFNKAADPMLGSIV